jgi:hypothetical protein
LYIAVDYLLDPFPVPPLTIPQLRLT